MLSKFDLILGVTGTLDCLGDFEKKALARYEISRLTYAPSVYGNSNRIDQPLLIESTKSEHMLKICRLLEEAMHEKRAMLVFFPDEGALQELYDSSYAGQFRKRMKVVTEKTPNRETHVRMASKEGQVTLFTASFARGTDFQVFNPVVKEKGLGVIQTYYPDDLSEEIQTKGRTARQGSKGTYQLVLSMEDLNSKYKITEEDINKAR
jgi:preprotein translocase subunit SecA